MGSAATIGVIVQSLTTFIAAIVLSFYYNWVLTFVILASFPLVTILVGLTEKFSAPLVALDREYTARSTSRLDRVLGAMPTVKAFNSEEREKTSFRHLTENAYQAYCRLHLVWGIRTGGTQFIMLSMFVQGFWFGAYQVRTGKSTVAAVNTCFWSCVVATTSLQGIVPLLVVLEKAKIATAGLLRLARVDPQPPIAVLTRSPPSSAVSPKFSIRRHRRPRARLGSLEGSEPFALRGLGMERAMPTTGTRLDDIPGTPLSPHPFHLTSPTTPGTPTFIPLNSAGAGRRTAPRALRKIQPLTFTGELSLRNVSFHYPTRPHPAPPALKDVSLYLAARETTYIVGGSGSGKSTVGSLLLGMYRPEEGRVEVDEQGLEWIDEDWLRSHVACVSQGASVIFDGTVHDNVAIGVVGQLREDGTKRTAKDVSREEVTAACRGALIHDFVRDLPEGYDTWLSGEKGASLSGGQRQRLAIARAWIRDPTVLILGTLLSPHERIAIN